LEPNLGIVKYREYDSFTVADIPGIIEGAHKGKGLGHQFLRHIERTNIILFLIDISSEDYEKDYEILYSELKNYSAKLIEKKILVSLSKSDLADNEKMKDVSGLKIGKDKKNPIIFSSVTNYGIQELLDTLWNARKNSASVQ
jgi:GTP-binding protein